MSQRLGPLDVNFWTIHTPTTPQVIASYCPLDGPPDLEAVRSAVSEQLDSFPKFRQRVVKKVLLHWEDDPHFDLAAHVKLLNVDADDQAGLAPAVEGAFSSPLDLSRPPWEMTLLTGSGPSAPAGVLFRIHHALADGLGGLEFFHRICRTERRVRTGEGLSGGTTSTKTAKTPPRFGVDFWQSLRRLMADSVRRTLRSELNGPNSSDRRLTFLELPLDDLRRLRRRVGASVNDVLLSLVAGAVGKYHEMRNAPLENVKVLMPLSLRGRGDLTKLGNHVTGVGVSLPVSQRDPFTRVKLIRAAINEMKKDGSIGAFRILGVLIAYLPERVRRRITDAAARRTNFICTNMPGPEQPLYLCGHKLLGNFGCAALLREHGIAFGFISYSGKMCISIVSDPAIVPDPRQLVRFFLDSFQELQEAS